MLTNNYSVDSRAGDTLTSMSCGASMQDIATSGQTNIISAQSFAAIDATPSAEEVKEEPQSDVFIEKEDIDAELRQNIIDEVTDDPCFITKNWKKASFFDRSKDLVLII